MLIYDLYFSDFGRPPVPNDFLQRFSPKASSVLEKKIFKGFYYIWAWWPSWSMDHNHFSNFWFPQPKKAPYEIWAKLAQRRSRLKTDGRTDRRTYGWTDGRKVITIAHPEHSSGELKIKRRKYFLVSIWFCQLYIIRILRLVWSI